MVRTVWECVGALTPEESLSIQIKVFLWLAIRGRPSHMVWRLVLL